VGRSRHRFLDIERSTNREIARRSRSFDTCGLPTLSDRRPPLAAGWPGSARGANHPSAPRPHPRGNSATLKGVSATPRPQKRLLQQVFGLINRSHHPVAVHVELPPVRPGEPTERGCITVDRERDEPFQPVALKLLHRRPARTRRRTAGRRAHTCGRPLRTRRSSTRRGAARPVEDHLRRVFHRRRAGPGRPTAGTRRPTDAIPSRDREIDRA